MELTLYAIRNHEGKWLRSKGFGGYGDPWIDDIHGAKFYGKLSPAKGRVTYYSRRFTQFPAPEIVEITASEFKVVPQNERVDRVNKEKKMREAKAVVARKRKEIDKVHQELKDAIRKAEELEMENA